MWEIFWPGSHAAMCRRCKFEVKFQKFQFLPSNLHSLTTLHNLDWGRGESTHTRQPIETKIIVYLWRKVVCFVVRRSIKPGCFRSCSECLWKALNEEGWRGAWAWFHGVWTCNAKVLEYWMISSLKISKKLECAFGVVGKIFMGRI
jgi:hypothetical protein